MASSYSYPTLEALQSLQTPEISFEFFPGKSEDANNKLWNIIKELEPLSPKYVSVTYGAGGSTQDGSVSLAKRIIKETGLIPNSHLTCVGKSRDEINAVAQELWNIGVRHVVALRGDAPGESTYSPHPDGYAYADDLVKGLLEIGDFDISVAAYPETHPQAESYEADIEHLKRKLDAGANQAITQYFFDVEQYFRFIDDVRAAGIDAPIIPGVLCVGGYDQLIRFSKMCGATVPEWVLKLLDPIKDDPEQMRHASTLIAAEQSARLVNAGVTQLHFYTLNHADVVKSVCNMLGVNSK